MDDTTLSNWFKVKEALEASGKTNSEIYKKAQAITAGRLNPHALAPRSRSIEES
jgi:hypothetical protein